MRSPYATFASFQQAVNGEADRKLVTSGPSLKTHSNLLDDDNGAARTAIAKRRSHMMSRFTTMLLNSGNLGPNYPC